MNVPDAHTSSKKKKKNEMGNSKGVTKPMLENVMVGKMGKMWWLGGEGGRESVGSPGRDLKKNVTFT